MNRILPFRGWRYSMDRVGLASSVVAPPYDVIDDDLLSQLYASSPYNSARLILPIAEYGRDKYESAGHLFNKWRHESVLFQEYVPAYYYVRQTFVGPTGEPHVRSGFTAVFGLEDDVESKGGIKGHEKTLDGPKADRLRIFQATNANLSPVFSVFSDPSREVDAIFEADANSRQPDFEAIDHLVVINQVWVLNDPEKLKRIQKLMADKPLLIADGHHRFETAGNYRDWIKKQGRWDKNSGCNGVMMYMANLVQPGLKIFPIHRTIHAMPQLTPAALRDKLSAQFDLRDLAPKTSWEEALKALGEGGPGAAPAFVVATKPDTWTLATLKGSVSLPDLLPDTPAALRPLDVVILHKLVFEKMLGMTVEDQAQKRYLDYHANPKRLLEMLAQPDTQAAIFIRALTGDQVRAVALAGEKMPQKSTYFYPKILTGIVFNDLAAPLVDSES